MLYFTYEIRKVPRKASFFLGKSRAQYLR